MNERNIWDSLTEHGSHTNEEMSNRTGLQGHATYRLLMVLLNSGCVTRVEDGKPDGAKRGTSKVHTYTATSKRPGIKADPKRPQDRSQIRAARIAALDPRWKRWIGVAV